jgi:hypothetical protein
VEKHQKEDARGTLPEAQINSIIKLWERIMSIIKRRSNIKNDLLRQLYWDPEIDAPQDITIIVAGSTVILSGTVPSAAARHSAEIDALLVPGIKRVENRLVVAGEEPH